MRFSKKTLDWVIPLSILTVAAFLMETSFTMITPFLQLYLVQELNVPASEVNSWAGWIFSISFFISALMGPVWGLLGDRTSRKLMAVRSSVGLAIAYAICGIVQTPFQLFMARFFQGFCAGLFPAILALLATNVPHRHIGFSMGTLQGGMTVGAIAGPFLGGLLAEIFGMRLSFFVGGVALIGVTILLFLVKEGKHEELKKKTDFLNIGVLKDSRIFLLVICSFVVSMSINCLQPILPLYLAQLRGSMENIMLVAGSVFSICGISVMFASPAIGYAAQEYGFLKILLICLFSTTVLTVCQVIPNSVAGFTAWRFFGGFATAGLMPTINSLLTKYSRQEDSGTIFGYSFLFSHFGMAFGPALAGMLANYISYATIIALSGLILLPLGFYLLLNKRLLAK
ncbi:MAG: MFS transporter [Burkholderiales bacterium]|nr:MFS transporter [Burkholderiales bacterium]